MKLSNYILLDFHPFGEFFASGSLDTNLKIWDIRRKGCIHTYKGHTRGVNAIRFTPDGRSVVSGGEDNKDASSLLISIAYDPLKNFEGRWLWASKPHGIQKMKKFVDDSLLRLERIPDILGIDEAHCTSEQDPEGWHVQVSRSVDSNSVKGFPKDPNEATSKVFGVREFPFGAVAYWVDLENTFCEKPESIAIELSHQCCSIGIQISKQSRILSPREICLGISEQVVGVADMYPSFLTKGPGYGVFDGAIVTNSSFIALIPKNHDPKFVNDYRPISLIGSLYKVVTKILATRLSSIISGLISDVQTAFLPNRQILDGPFIINELLSWCKHKKQQAMVFKVDFAKAYDSIRWDFLEDVLRAFGFGSKWCSWIRGCLHSGMASVLLNGSPTSEFQFHCGLKQGDPLAPYLFILIMESLHLSLSRAIEAGIFKGIKIGSSLNISHLFYADDAVFIGEWSIANLSGITHILHCFSLLSGLSINLKKSHLLGVGIRSEDVNAAALYFGCSTMKTPFKYLGVMVGGNSSTLQAWDDTIGKLKARLSNWKLKTLSVGGRLTLLKSVLGSTPIYNMSIYKVPKSVLQTMESIRRNFFNGVQCDERKIVWIKWAKVLASKKYGGLGVSSFYALNRALLFKWVWRFISRDNSLWCRLIMSMHGSSLYKLSPFRYSTWKSIIREVHMLKDRGVDLISHCHIRVGNGLRTQFWNEVWIGDTQLRVMFPRIYALEINKDCTVADKLQFSVTSSLRRSVRGGVESSQLALLQTYIEGTLLSNMEDRWVWDLNGEGVFRVKDVRILLDECFLPKAPTATRWVKYVPIKINVFAWKVFLDRLPTRSNLQHRGVLVSDLLCPLCSSAQEDSSHLFFSCRLATDIVRLVCRWWNLSWTPLGSYADWLNWFNSIRLSSKVKDLLEGVLYITWWSVWMFRNQLLFSSKAPRKDVIFDDIVSRSFTWCLSRCNCTFSWEVATPLFDLFVILFLASCYLVL
ncbi:RNA-directed DNA polymerase, eukaryota [Tanacetum coccineum]